MSGTINTSTYNLAYNNAAWGVNQYLRVRCLSATLYDEITIVKLYDGVDGNDGTDGTDGEDGVTNVIGYLTNENITLPTLSDGTGYSLTGAGGYFSVFYGITDVSTSASYTIVGGSSAYPLVNKTQNGLTLSISMFNGGYTLSGSNWTSNQETFTINATYNGVIISKIFKISKAKQGLQGIQGLRGDVGPGVIYQGAYQGGVYYLYDSIRRDVVSVSGVYYTVKNMGSVINVTPPNTNYWEQMSTFKSVATDILLANNATITKGLVMGDATTKGFIRSYGMNSLTSGTGFYLDGNGPLRLGNVTGNNLYWNGTTLALTGSITATNLTLTNNATITKGLIMGTSAENGYIRSYGMSSLTSGTGFYLNGLDGKFTFGNASGSRVEWNGSNLNVYTSPYSIELNEEAKTIIAKNHTKSAVVVYYKVWTTTEPTSYTTGSSIPANSSITISNSAWKPQFRYYVKVRFGSSGPIYTDRFTNFTDNHYYGYWDVLSSVTGGSVDTISAVFIPILSSNYIERYAVYINGIVTVSSSTGTASLTLNQPIGDMVVVASPYLTTTTGGGGDLAYGYSYSTGSVSVIQLTKDYATNTHSNQIAFTVSGYYIGGL